MTDAPAQQGGQPTKARVFISYSRKDIAFANRLDGALRAKFTSGTPRMLRSRC